MWRKKFHEFCQKSNPSENDATASQGQGSKQAPKVFNMGVQLITGPSSFLAQADKPATNNRTMLSGSPKFVLDVSRSGEVGRNYDFPEAQVNGLVPQQSPQHVQSTHLNLGNPDVPSLSTSVHGQVVDPPCTDPRLIDGHWHYSHRSPWLRALVLGANDGLVSISSLMLGVGAVKNDVKAMIISGLAGLVAGAGSMAIGEFVSVFSQRDTELADLEKERQEHEKGPEAEAKELEELALIYVGRGLPYYLAKQVAVELSKVDALRAHARDELGIDIDSLSNPLQAALASSMAFSLGGGVPLLAGAFIQTLRARIAVVVASSSFALVAFGALGARLGGAPMWKAALRVLVGGWLAMGLTYGTLRLLGTSGF